MNMYEVSDVFYLRKDDIIIKEKFTVDKLVFPLIAIHKTGFYIFLDDGPILDDNHKKEIIDKVYHLQLYFNISRIHFFTYCFDEQYNFEYLDPYHDMVHKIDDIKKELNEKLDSFSIMVNESKMTYYRDKIEFGDKKKKQITDSEGNTYIKKHGNWIPVSTEDSDEAFKKVQFGGLFGVHKFSAGKKLQGMLYLLTLGLLGIGWLADMLAFLLGVARDSEGYIYAPLSDIKKGWITFAVCVPIAFLAIVAYHFIFQLLISGSGVVGEKIAPMIAQFDGATGI